MQACAESAMWKVTEKLLHFIWRFRRFNSNELVTTSGLSLDIIYVGSYNADQGPDFSFAKIRIDDTILVGNIEIHIKSSDWYQHKHEQDVNYDSIILHVVWQDDKPVIDKSGQPISTLVLAPLVSDYMLKNYEQLMEQVQIIPCSNFLPAMPDITWMSWKERMAAERLAGKAEACIPYLKQVHNHWEEVCWWLLARGFGMKTNAMAFELMARSIPVTVLLKHKEQIHQLEALLMGQSSLLDQHFDDDYPNMLKREYLFLRKKYNLRSISRPPLFLRMRPANFPTVRLAQLAMILHTHSQIFSKLKEAASPKDAAAMLDATANDYWHYHYLFDQETQYKEKNTGDQLLHHVIINSLSPLFYAYGTIQGDEKWKQKAIQWLSAMKTEENKITRLWKKYNVICSNAMESQGLLHLQRYYCQEKKCLDCAVGMKVLQNKPST